MLRCIKLPAHEEQDDEASGATLFESLISEVPGLSQDDIAMLVEMNAALEESSSPPEEP